MAGHQGEKPLKVINGYAKLVAMFRMLDPVFRVKLLDKLRVGSPLLASLVEQMEFTWWDIPRLDDNSVQKVLSKIPERDWLLAWKLADDSIKSVLLSNMSENRRKEFIEKFDALPRVPRVQVQKTMFHIGKQIREMAMRGELNLLTRPRKGLHLKERQE